MELRPNMLKNSLILYISLVALDIIYFYAFMGLSFDVELWHYILLLLINVPAIGLYTSSLIKTKYVLKTKTLYHIQLFRVVEIPYDEIAYIDRHMSSTTPNLYAIKHDKKTLILTLDKNKVLLEELLKRCHNLLTVDQMEERGFFEQNNDIQKEKKK